MIPLPRFELYSPKTLAEAIAALAHSKGGANILAGGTDLIANIKHGVAKPERVVWLGKLPEMRTISFTPELGLRIGAMCTLNEIAVSSSVQQYYPAIAKAAHSVASPAIRNCATLGGNLCQDTRCFYYNQSEFWRSALGGCIKALILPASNGAICHATPGLAKCAAVFCSDLAPLLIALSASVKLMNQRGERTIDLAELYRDDGANHLTLQPGEIVTEVSIPTAQPNQFSVYKKLRDRRSIDFALVNVGLNIVLDSELICRHAKIIIGAVQSIPVEVRTAEAIFVNRRLTTELIGRAAEEAASAVTPVPNVDEPVGYRKRMVRVLVERALSEVWSRASKKSTS